MKLNECALVEAIALCEREADTFQNWDEAKPLEDQLGTAAMQFLAARKALGIANRLKNPNDLKKHRSRIIGMMNKLRASLVRLEKAIVAEYSVIDNPTPEYKGF